mgnify:CR=1 FL=1|jgi:hypothetical protein
MTIQPFKNIKEKETFERELKDMVNTPWRENTNKLHKEWCKNNGYSTAWSKIKVGRPKKNET